MKYEICSRCDEVVDPSEDDYVEGGELDNEYQPLWQMHKHCHEEERKEERERQKKTA
jgi:hypothetical protein